MIKDKIKMISQSPIVDVFLFATNSLIVISVNKNAAIKKMYDIMNLF